MTKAWFGIDLDGCLAVYESGQWPNIGTPVPAMVAIVKRLLEEGNDVRIFTARVCGLYLGDEADGRAQEALIKAWCKVHLGVALPVTAVKDYDMTMLLDDRAVTIEKNTGKVLTQGWTEPTK